MSAGHGDAIRALLPGCSDDVLNACEAVGLNADDVRSDIHRVRTGVTTREQLTDQVTDGAEDDESLMDAWREYVLDVCLAAGVSS